MTLHVVPRVSVMIIERFHCIAFSTKLLALLLVCMCVYYRNELSWRYQTLLQSLERKKTEVEQLSQEFESKIRAKEVYDGLLQA